MKIFRAVNILTARLWPCCCDRYVRDTSIRTVYGQRAANLAGTSVTGKRDTNPLYQRCRIPHGRYGTDCRIPRSLSVDWDWGDPTTSRGSKTSDGSNAKGARVAQRAFLYLSS